MADNSQGVEIRRDCAYDIPSLKRLGLEFSEKLCEHNVEFELEKTDKGTRAINVCPRY